jgi:single-stranded-DNA-specific exonuclease
MDLPLPDRLVLGVERSLGGKRWLDGAGDARAGLALAQSHGLPEIVGRLLAARGVPSDGVAAYLEPRLAALLPDPSHLLDMDRAVARLLAAVEGGEKIAVFGDYDVDGATSSALLARFFRALGVALRVYIPDRRTEGYGPNAPALAKLKDEGCRVVVTVDCGITAYEPLKFAKEQGLDVIVIDHHVAEAGLPAAVAVVNPNRIDETSPHRQLAAVGVAYLLVVALNRALRADGFYQRAGRPEPNLLSWLDIVALGTVADVVPLTGVNRALVAQGLKVLAKRDNAGLRALADVARLDEAPAAYHLGFVLGPRVNAGGRVGEAELGARLLASDDDAEARAIALRLDAYNRERQKVEETILNDALARAERELSGPVAFVSGEGWHAGVIGIVASRLKDRFNRVSCVAAIQNGVATGSARSMPGFDLGAAVIAARQSGLLTAGGGHAMAAGFSCAADKLPHFRAFLEERVARHVVDTGAVPTLTIDGQLEAGGASLDLVREIARLGPFGSGNSEPRFVISGVRVARADPVGTGHVRCTLAGATGGRLAGIAFRCLDGPLGHALMDRAGPPLHVAGRLGENVWQGRSSVQIVIDDAASAHSA